MLVAALVVIINAVIHANGGFPSVLGLGFVPSAVLLATASYLVLVTAGMTLGLIRHGCLALATSEGGIEVRSAWFSRTIPWNALSQVGLDVRYGKLSHHTVVAVRETTGPLRVHSIDTRLLAEPLDCVKEWAEAAERQRLARGGAPHEPALVLAAYAARMRETDIAADVAAARRGSPGEFR
ncbi:hypothetical protein HMF7854_08035 [Sphingomonas ginkgonis]|uniref:PH domain-containing protein n=1 Tax=Sphingomonas ginkgonis TaxID=2315330 RepID=A0A429V9Y0_9SPHN|nr:hypothetical protein [Sphingomonas ginkgonis]RST30793.1 hypothetical protein HMF7854_08035 [Sphingomonas ginkgonis]